MPRTVAPAKTRTKIFTLTGGFLMAGALAAAIFVGNAAVRSHGPVSPDAADTARQQYDAAYQASFRSDGGQQGAATVDAVFEYPALVSTLEGYAQRSVIQSQTLDVLANVKVNRETLAFVITAAVGTADESLSTTVATFDFPSHSVLTDDRGRTYGPMAWNELAPFSNAARTGVLTFERTVDQQTMEEAKARTIQLSVTDFPGGTRTFAWDLRVLGITPE